MHYFRDIKRLNKMYSELIDVARMIVNVIVYSVQTYSFDSSSDSGTGTSNESDLYRAQ